MRFSGLHKKSDIPSKAFHLLNKIAVNDTEPAPVNNAKDYDDEGMFETNDETVSRLNVIKNIHASQ